MPEEIVEKMLNAGSINPFYEPEQGGIGWPQLSISRQVQLKSAAAFPYRQSRQTQAFVRQRKGDAKLPRQRELHCEEI